MFIGFEEIKLITEIYNIVGNLLLECNNLGYKGTDFKSGLNATNLVIRGQILNLSPGANFLSRTYGYG